MNTDYSMFSANTAMTEFVDMADVSDLSTTGIAATSGLIGGALAGMFTVMLIIFLVIGILTIIADWKIFTKAGQKGWKSIIPIYNLVVLFRIAGISPWWILAYLATAIPFIGWMVSLGLSIYLMINLSKAFGKSSGFTVGLILLNTIFIMILAFGDSKYQLKETETVVEAE